MGSTATEGSQAQFSRPEASVILVTCHCAWPMAEVAAINATAAKVNFASITILNRV